MFFLQLYRYNKLLFFTVVFFLLAYLFLNYKWGIAATPIQQYGMFSGPQFINDTLSIYIVEVNGRRINESSISQTQRDIIQSYPAYYENQDLTNTAVYDAVSRILRFSPTQKENNRRKFVNNVDGSTFLNWYKKKLAVIINEPVVTLQLYKQRVAWQQGRINALGEPVKLSFIAAK